MLGQTLEVIEEAIEKGAQVEIHFFDKEREEAQELIQSISGKLQRTWEERESECGETYWFETVDHDEDQINVAVFYEKNKK